MKRRIQRATLRLVFQYGGATCLGLFVLVGGACDIWR
jgi:hypothetical protein